MQLDRDLRRVDGRDAMELRLVLAGGGRRQENDAEEDQDAEDACHAPKCKMRRMAGTSRHPAGENEPGLLLAAEGPEAGRAVGAGEVERAADLVGLRAVECAGDVA